MQVYKIDPFILKLTFNHKNKRPELLDPVKALYDEFLMKRGFAMGEKEGIYDFKYVPKDTVNLRISDEKVVLLYRRGIDL